jgi:pimeloyl-ACP methyl ester carboxylesterase
MNAVRALLGSMLYFPSREFLATPADVGLAYRDLEFESGDGERLHGWWVDARGQTRDHLLLCHGNAGNVGDRVLHAELLTAVGFDVMLFDYRGYGRSSGRPDEAGTYEDAHAALACLREQPGVDPGRVFYLGESLGGAVAIELATAHPPAGLVLLSTFTSVRAMARVHYPVLPAALVPNAYPSLDLIRELHVPLLVLHGDRDDIVPLEQGRELFDAAPGPKQMRVYQGAGHNDLLDRAGRAVATEVAEWAMRARS